jgi:hypothetical protein
MSTLFATVPKLCMQKRVTVGKFTAILTMQAYSQKRIIAYFSLWKNQWLHRVSITLSEFG